MPKRILMIDDEEAICHFTKLNLERKGEFVVTTALSGAAGIEKANTEPFDLVITDFRMPGLTGIDVLNAVKAITPRCPVVLFSIYHDDESVLPRAVKAKADGVISKPIDYEQLYGLIQDVLAKHQSKDKG